MVTAIHGSVASDSYKSESAWGPSTQPSTRMDMILKFCLGRLSDIFIVEPHKSRMVCGIK
jgi:hypothetical protein